MADLSEAEKSQIIALIEEGTLSREEIAAKVGESPETIGAIHAHLTRGTYDGRDLSTTETANAMLSQKKVEELLGLIKKRFPNWTGFSDPDFREQEVDYKQRTVAKARELISAGELQRLIQESSYDEMIDRVLKVGRDSNLLWHSVPSKGDCSVLFDPSLDKLSFCNAFQDLLYGYGPSPERLGRYVQYLRENNLPNKWTFPTYFLFMCHPDSEMFVKPRATKRFLKLVGQLDLYDRTPGSKNHYCKVCLALEVGSYRHHYRLARLAPSSPNPKSLRQ